MTGRDNNYNFWIGNGYPETAIYKGTCAHGHHIGARAAGITAQFVNAETFVLNKSCYSDAYHSAWSGRRVHIGFTGDGVSLANTFWAAMETGSTITDAKDGIMVLQGAGSTILRPKVLTSPEYGTIVPAGGLTVVWTFDGAMTGTPTGDGIVSVCGGSWTNDHTYTATLCVVSSGQGWVTGNFTSGNGIALDHLSGQWGFFVGTNGAADVSLGIVGQTALVKVSSEFQTDAYFIESAESMEGPWEQVGIELQRGFAEHQMDVSDAFARGHTWFRLCEREEDPDENDEIPAPVIVHEYAQQTDLSAQPARLSSAKTTDYYIQKIDAQTAARENGQLVLPLPANIGEGEKLICYTVAAFADAVETWYASYWRFYGYEVIVEIVPGYPSTAEEEDAQIADLQARIDAHTAEGARYHMIWGSDNDYHYLHGERWPLYWTGPWFDIRTSVVIRYLPQPDHVVIPGYTVRDDLPRERNTAWWWPYYRSDQPYERPGIVVGRISVTSIDEIAVASLNVQWTNDLCWPSPSMNVGMMLGDLDYRYGDGAVATASADTVANFLQSQGSYISWVRQSEFPNNEERNLECADFWNHERTNLIIMFSTVSGPHYPGNMFSKRELGPFAWTMDFVYPYLNHHPFIIGGTCGIAAAYATDDDMWYGRAVIDDMMFHEAGSIGQYAPGCGSLIKKMRPIVYHATTFVYQDLSRPFFESVALAEEYMEIQYADDPLLIKQLDTMQKIGCVLSRLGQVQTVTGVGDGETPHRIVRLDQNYPNPFNPKTTIRFNTTRKDRVSLKIYDVAGRLVMTLLEEVIDPGLHTVIWDGKDSHGRQLASAPYLCTLQAEGKSLTNKLLLLK